MSWIKDNLIFVLAGLVIVLGTGWVITTYIGKANYASLETQFVQAKSDRDTAVGTNKANVEALKKLIVSTNRLVAVNKANVAAARSAGARADAFKAQLDAASRETKQLRALLAKQNPEVDNYLRTAMPRKLYCQTWPEACK